MTFTLIAASGVVLPVVAGLLMSDSLGAVLERLRTWLLANHSTITTVLLLLLGTKVFGSGIANL